MKSTSLYGLLLCFVAVAISLTSCQKEDVEFGQGINPSSPLSMWANINPLKERIDLEYLNYYEPFDEQRWKEQMTAIDIPLQPSELEQRNSNDLTLFEYLSYKPEFSKLLSALEITQDWRDTVVFSQMLLAPTNAAFDAFEAETGRTIASYDNEEDRAILNNVLSYHFLPRDRERPSSISSVNGFTASSIYSLTVGFVELYIDAPNNEMATINGVANVTKANQFVGTGTLHHIDKVLTPARITDLLAFTEGADSMYVALNRPDLPEEVVMLMNEFMSLESEVTAFIPTDAAFNRLLQANGWGSIADIPVEVLAKVLPYHFTPNGYCFFDFLFGVSEVETFANDGNGQNLNLAVSTSPLTFGGIGNSAVHDRTIAGLELAGINGAVFFIDEVLLPF